MSTGPFGIQIYLDQPDGSGADNFGYQSGGNDRGLPLTSTVRYRYTRWWAPLLVEPVEMISVVMSQKMLRGIRDRAGP